MLKKIGISLCLLIILLLSNTVIFLLVLKYNPSLLIHNHHYQKSHQEIITYLLNGNASQLNKTLTINEIKHLTDVRTIIIKIPIVLFLLLVITNYLIKKHQNISIFEVSKYSLIILLLIILAGVIAFMPLFIFFHQIFFPQGNWSFPEDSVLIQLYPEQFWQTATISICLLTFIELATTCFFTYRKRFMV